MSFIRFLQAILYGIVEGITEWLPVSSTGHLIILNQWFKINEIYGDSYWSFFEVVIQLGAILAVIVSFLKYYGLLVKVKQMKKRNQLGFYYFI